MKKLFLLAAIAITVSASAQVKGFESKTIDAKSTKTKASSALKTSKEKKGASAFTAADDCGAFTKTETDKEGVSYQASKDWLVVSNDGTTGFGITMSNFMLEGDKYVMLIGVGFEKGFCIAKGSSKIVVTFEDETQVSFVNFQADNCEGIVKTFIGKKVGNEATLEQLKTKNVRSIKIVGVEKSIVKPLTETNQVQLQGTVKCL